MKTGMSNARQEMLLVFTGGVDLGSAFAARLEGHVGGALV